MDSLHQATDTQTLSTNRSPKRNNFVHRRRNNSEVMDELHLLRSQLEQAQKRIWELEGEVERLLSDDARSRRRLVEQKYKHEEEVEELKSRIKMGRIKLPETLESAVTENMAMVTTLHKELLGEMSSFQARTERKLKSKEQNLQQTFHTKMQQLERELETHRQHADDDHRPDQTEANAPLSLEAKVRQFEDFNSRLQAANRQLREKVKDVQAQADLFADQHTNILRENAKMRKQLQEKQESQISTPVKPLVEVLPPVSVSTGKVQTWTDSTQAKLASVQRELKTVKTQLVQERSKRTELAQLLDRCVEDVKAQAVSMAAYSGRFRGDISGKEREMIIKGLLEDEHVLELVKNNAFPQIHRPLPRSSSVVTLR